ncbi:MAG: cyclic nucleotide-binding domain-containing protein [Roseiflexaceae bacterium]|nr:cyclic nucleotide-binding domain-containing protein [Roseiflexaceae bacterium]
MAASTDTRHQDAAKRHAAAVASQLQQVREHQAAALALLDCLAGTIPEHLQRLAEYATMRAFIPGAIVIDEHEPGEFLYLVLRGTVCLRLHDRAGREVLIGFLGRGDCFGEGSLFGDQFRSASARAETICYLIQLPLPQVRTLLAESPELDTTLRTIYRQRLVASTLGRVPLFGQLTPLARAEIADMLIQQHYARGTLIIKQGMPGDALYLIESGQVVVEAEERAIAHLDEGDFFGEMSLLTKEPHNADVRTLTPTDVLTLPADAFQHLLESQPALGEQMRDVVARRRITSTTMRQDVVRSQQLEAALERGLLRGRHVLVRDPQLCLEGCKLCTDACTTRHGSPRLHTGGVQLNGMDVTDSCRQCRVGAECVEVCPSDAIRWNHHGALIITDSCTGCGECVAACPYDAVTLAPRNRSHNSPLWGLWERLQRTYKTIPLEPVGPTHRADKCDLCHGYDDLACVSACPTGALRLAPVEEVFPL